jgi:hypothetical protein
MKVAKKTAVVKKAAVVREAKILVSDTNIGKAAMRLLAQKLVSTEVQYVQRTLGSSASQNDIDAQVLAVRKLPWASIVVAD